MLIDCQACLMLETDACSDCIVTVILQRGPGMVALDESEESALQNLAEVGLVPQLRLVTEDDRPAATA